MYKPPFKLARIAGKGEGIISVREISYGELILQEQPIMTQKNTFSNLTTDEQKLVMGLHDSHEKNGNKTFKGIYDTNSCTICNFEAGLFITLSKFNHSCVPNIASMYVNPYLRVYATRKIKVDEELCFCYYGKFTDYIERQKNLSLRWGFTCYCELCKKQSLERNNIEQARIEYKELNLEIKMCNDFSRIKFLQNLRLRKIIEGWLLDPIRKYDYHLSMAGVQENLGNLEESRRHTGHALGEAKIIYGDDFWMVRLLTKYFDGNLNHRQFVSIFKTFIDQCCCSHLSFRLI